MAMLMEFPQYDSHLAKDCGYPYVSPNMLTLYLC